MLNREQILEALDAEIAIYRTSRDVLERGLGRQAGTHPHALGVYVADLCALKNKLQAMEQFRTRLGVSC